MQLRILILSIILSVCSFTTGVYGRKLKGTGGFVQRSGHQLTLDGQPFYFIGANAYWLQDLATQGKKSEIDLLFSKCAEYKLRVVRIWGFNHNSPKARGDYDENEMQAYDYIIDSAGQHGVNLIIALGNTWTAYRSPEDFMRIAGEPVTDLLGFYQSDKVKSFYKDHIVNYVNRVNTINGKAYKDDPTIMMWDVFNEPRCPGCTEQWQQQVHQAWLREMADTLKGAAPSQLIAAGTEGYFMDSENVRWNPGAGVYCEGEDWLKINQIGSIDVTISHTYDRQLESIPPDWRQPNWDDLMNWFQDYMSAHERAARSVGKPHVMEEFNIILPKYNQEQRTQLFRMVYDYLISNKNNGGAFSGAMFWNAAIGSDVWDDGYNIYLDVAPVAPAPGAPAVIEPERKGITANTETLNDFRRGPQRHACAEEQAKSWTPLWTEPSARTVDVSGYVSKTSGKRVQDVIRDAGNALY